MDFTGYYEFPFPTVLSEHEEKLRDYFFALSDSEQYEILSHSKSYSSMCEQIEQEMSFKAVL